MSEIDVPVIDLSPWTTESDAEARGLVVAAVRDACVKCGFMVVTGHGVDPRVIGDMWRETRGFFDSDLPNKEAVEMGDGEPYGYSGMEKEVTGADMAYGKGDLKESFAVALGPAAGRHDAMPADRWPAQPALFPAATTDYYRAMERLAETILRIVAVGLGVEEEFFVAKQRRHWSALRLMCVDASVG